MLSPSLAPQEEDMALHPCKECKQQISSDAKVCPHCGKKVGMGMGVKMLILIGVLLLWFSSHDFNNSGGTAPTQPNQTAPATSTLASQTEQDSEDTARGKNAFTAGMLLRASMRNPESLVVEEAWSNKSGSMICIAYRAQNGFGGMNRENAFETGGMISVASPASYKKLCRDATFEQTWNVEGGAKISMER
jgi:hypothetical protein